MHTIQSSAEDRIPVIVGVGEYSDHPSELTAGLEPIDLMVEALKRAEQDSGGALLADVQSLDIINFLSWRYHDPVSLLCERLGIAPAHAYYGPVGGESPIRYIHEAAKQIARGECGVAAICGGEAQSTVTRRNAPASRCRGLRSRTTPRCRCGARVFRNQWPPRLGSPSR